MSTTVPTRAVPGTSPVRPLWLTEPQQQLWRQWLAGTHRLPAELNRRLQADSGLSLSDFSVLVQLDEAPDHHVRMSALAAALGWERSRLSHHVRRMESRDLVRRTDCDDDGRGSDIEITATGAAAILGAAPAHVDAVRELVFATLTDEELATVTSFTTRMLQALADHSSTRP